MSITATSGRIKIKTLKENSATYVGQEVLIAGWVRTARKQKTFTFIEVNDGSTLSNFQVIGDENADVSTGSAVRIEGKIVESPGQGQSIEMQATNLEVVGEADESFPFKKSDTRLSFYAQ